MSGANRCKVLDKCPVSWVPGKCPVSGVPDKCPVSGVPDKCPVSGVPDKYPVSGAPDKCPVSGVPDKCPVSGVPDKCPVCGELDKCPVPFWCPAPDRTSPSAARLCFARVSFQASPGVTNFSMEPAGTVDGPRLLDLA